MAAAFVGFCGHFCICFSFGGGGGCLGSLLLNGFLEIRYFGDGQDSCSISRGVVLSQVRYIYARFLNLEGIRVVESRQQVKSLLGLDSWWCDQCWFAEQATLSERDNANAWVVHSARAES